MKTVSKQNINPIFSSDEYGLRKTIPLKISSILKSSNILQTKKTLAEVTLQYEKDKQKFINSKAKTPLIKIDEQKNKKTSLFLKNAKNSVKIAPKFFKEKSLSIKESQIQQLTQDSCNEEDQLDGKLMELISMITEDVKPLSRCHSSITLNLKTPTGLMSKIGAKIDKQIPLPPPIQNALTSECSQTPFVRVKTPSFLSRPSSNLRYSQMMEIPSRNQLIKSSYFGASSNLVASEQRMSLYQPSEKVQTTKKRLCINCESYVSVSSVSSHEEQCLGFKIILKMSNQQLIDFLNKKIQSKLNQLQHIEIKINELKKETSQREYTQILNLNQQRASVDQILNDLHSIRLKALKKFHTKNPKTKNTRF